MSTQGREQVTSDGPGSSGRASSARRLGYISGAPRVSTRGSAEAAGPRAHILGVIGGFETAGWVVDTFIAGDRIHRRIVDAPSQTISGSPLRAFGVDLVRVASGIANRRLAWRALRGRVDWVYERFASFQAIGREFQRHDIPWILETQGLFFEEASKDRKSMSLAGLAKHMELAAYRGCDVLVCVSRALRDLVVDAGKIDPAKILIVPNAVDLDRFRPREPSVERPFEGPTLVFVGSLIPWQGLEPLLRALHVLNQEWTVRFNLVVAGEGPARKDSGRLVRELGLERQVRFVGRLEMDEVPGLIAACDLGYVGHVGRNRAAVYHSPLKLYEYMAMGRPVVASMSEDALSVVREGVTGFLFRGGDATDLAQALLRAHRVWPTLVEMGIAAREEIAKHHTWAIRVDAMIQGIEAILRERRPRRTPRG